MPNPLPVQAAMYEYNGPGRRPRRSPPGPGPVAGAGGGEAKPFMEIMGVAGPGGQLGSAFSSDPRGGQMRPAFMSHAKSEPIRRVWAHVAHAAQPGDPGACRR